MGRLHGVQKLKKLINKIFHSVASGYKAGSRDLYDVMVASMISPPPGGVRPIFQVSDSDMLSCSPVEWRDI